MYYFTLDNQLVIAACSPNPSIIQLKQLIEQVENWDQVCNKLIKKGVAPLFLDILEQNPDLIISKVSLTDYSKTTENIDKATNKGVPIKTVAKLRQAYLMTLRRSIILYDTFREVAEALNGQGIKAVALKGIYLAEHLYSRIGLRQFSDIDLLFRKADVEAALSVFRQLGFQMEKPAFEEYIRNIHEPAHLPHLLRNGISVELHTRLHGPLNEYKLNEDEFFSRAVPVIINHQPFYTFDKHDLLIHLCIHLDQHLKSTHIQFYSFADIGILMKNIEPEILLSRCNNYGATNIVYRTLNLVHSVFNAPINQTIIQNFTGEVSPAIIKRLTNHLDDQVDTPLFTKTHFQFLKKINNTKEKIHYILGVTFPSREHMIRAYKISNKKFYRLWYVYRLWLGFKGLFAKNNLKNN